jgi:phosphatidylglycerol lysyltransferase
VGLLSGTMGRFCPSYIENQLVLVAKHNGKPVAFITLHTGPEEWALDIMRDCPTAPDGSMYQLVHAAIQMAATAKITKLSLAAVPITREAGESIQSILLGYMCEKFTSKGLAQFKSTFNPKWEPLYMLSPNRLGLCLGAIDLLREIHRPPEVGSANANPGAHPKHQRRPTPLLQI